MQDLKPSWMRAKQAQVSYFFILALPVLTDWNKRFTLGQGWANYGLPSAFLWSPKNLYQARATLPLFSFSTRLIPYKRIINMYQV